MSRIPSAAPLSGALILLLTLLSGCESMRRDEDGLFAKLTPYRIEVVQGNVVTSEQAARVKPGLTRAQVRDLLGTPLVSDAFHADRWDYIFTIRRDGLPNQRRSVVLWFEGDALKTIEAPNLPTERDFVSAISTDRRKHEPPQLELTPEQVKALPAPKAPAAAAPVDAAASGPVRTYPRLGD